MNAPSKVGWPSPSKWPWLNPYCRDCKNGTAHANKDAGGQVWQEMRCEHPAVLQRARDLWGYGFESVIVEAEQDCALFKKKITRAYKPRPRAGALTNFKYE